MQEEELRKEAVRRYLGGERSGEILADLKRSRAWLHKWLARYHSQEENWYVSKSKAPHQVANRTLESRESLVVTARRELESIKYAQVGANAIKWRLRSLGLLEEQLLEIWTINRILKRHGIPKKKVKYTASGRLYPQIAAEGPNELHEADLVGPRYLSGPVRFYSFNVLDKATHQVAINPIMSKVDVALVESLISSWQRLGCPRLVQFDNQQALKGSNRYPRSFGLVIRVCLSLGITPVFIPVSEPWRNPEIEKFNDVWDKTFFRTQTFSDFDALKAEASLFEEFHNENHRYGILGHKTPNEALLASGYEPVFPESKSVLSREPREGVIHLIRFIRTDQILSVFSERFRLDQSMVYQYVIATIYVKEQMLIVTCQGEHVASFKYELPWM